MRVKSIPNYRANAQVVVNTISNPAINNARQINDSFNKQNSVAFKGNLYPSGDFNEVEIRRAKDSLMEGKSNWAELMYEKFYQHLKDSRPDWEGMSRSGGRVKIDMNSKLDRTFMGIISLGLSEGMLQAENAIFRSDARKHVDLIKTIRSDLINEKYREDAEASNIRSVEAANDVQYMKKLNEIKDKQIHPLFLDLIQREKEGHPSDIPNCVMISCGNDSVNKDLIDWTGKNANGRFSSISHDTNLLEHLEQAEHNYQNTRDWNIIHIKNGDRLINPKLSTFSCLESMKDIMSATAEDYHTTLLFSSEKPESLDNIAMQPHRVRRITGNVISLEDMNIAAAKLRLNSKRAMDCPINTMNDLISFCRINISKLPIGYSPSGVYDAERSIKAVLSEMDNKEFLSILAKAASKLRI